MKGQLVQTQNSCNCFIRVLNERSTLADILGLRHTPRMKYEMVGLPLSNFGATQVDIFDNRAGSIQAI